MDTEIDFEMVAAKLRANCADTAVFVKTLAYMLESSLPASSTVTKQGGFLAKESIKAISVDLGETVLVLEVNGSRLEAAKKKAVRGIVLKTEPISMETFIVYLVSGIKAESEKAESVTRAMENFLLG